MKKRRLQGILRRCLTGLGFVCLIAAVFIIFLLFSKHATTPEEPEQPAEVKHRVLFISSYNSLYFTYPPQAAGLEKSLYPKGIEYDVIFMDAKNYSTVSDKMSFYEHFKEKMKGRRKYEAVILGDDDALSFALQNRDEFFSTLPVVFFGINDLDMAVEAQKYPNFTGFYEECTLADLIELTTKLFPDRKNLIGIHDLSSAGEVDQEIFNELASGYPEHKFIDINTALMTQTELIKAFEKMPEDGVIIFMTCYADIDGNNYSLLDRTNFILTHTDLPVLRNHGGAENTGVVGAISLDFGEQCYNAGELVAQILEGGDISGRELVMDTNTISWYDHSVASRFKLNTSLFPSDAVIYNKPETIMEKYSNIIPPVVLIIFALISFILAARLNLHDAVLANKELAASKEIIEKSEKEMKYRAEHDDLLGLYNRRTAAEYIGAEYQKGRVFSVVMADIDGFKNVNESYGHQITDEILKTIASDLKKFCSERNWFLSRYGGDEFLFMAPDVHMSADDEAIQALLELYSKPVKAGGEQVSMAASIGISNSDGDTSSDQHILNAESAMYVAKSRGGNGAFVFSEEMREKQKEDEVIRDKLLEAFENDGFYMLYQPQINSFTKEVSGFEALVRMKEPGMYPGKFIPVAEQNGWIWKIGRITTELVIRQLAKWKEEGKKLYPVSINFSSNQINDTGYLGLLEELLEKYDIPAKYLEIEITEGLFLDRNSQSEALFRKFKEMGIRLLMDDFGTGYSSLGYLTYIPVDVIKLDKSLVDAYLVDGKDSFIKDVIQLMHDLNKEMIIEGVEEAWQFDRLREFGADVIQGYYFSRPIKAEEAIDFKVRDDRDKED